MYEQNFIIEKINSVRYIIMLYELDKEIRMCK
jgi:hypothetical protein